MDKRARIPHLFFLLIVFQGLMAVLCSLAEAVPHLRVTAHENLIDIQAEQSPINDVFRAIAAETGLRITSSSDLTDKVSLSIRNVPVETAIRRVLLNRNYMVLLNCDKEGRLVSVNLRVVGGGLENALEIKPGPSAPPPDDSMKRLERDWFAQTFSDSGKLLKQVSAVSEKDGPLIRGMRITKLAKDSPFVGIGLKEGDIIHDVNGRAVNNVKELVDAFKKATEAPYTTVRIERLNSNRMIDPIYIEIQ